MAWGICLFQLMNEMQRPMFFFCVGRAWELSYRRSLPRGVSLTDPQGQPEKGPGVRGNSRGNGAVPGRLMCAAGLCPSGRGRRRWVAAVSPLLPSV